MSDIEASPQNQIDETPETKEELTQRIDALYKEYEKHSTKNVKEASLVESKGRELGASLSKYKSLYVGKGRDGHWRPFLEKHNIDRKKADRLVNKYRREVQPSMPKHQKQPTPLTNEQLSKLVEQENRKLHPRLNTIELVEQFVQNLSEKLLNEIARKSNEMSHGIP